MAGFFAGCLVFFGGDRMIDRLGGVDREDAKGRAGGRLALAIVVGTVLDGVPESMVIGLSRRDPQDARADDDARGLTSTAARYVGVVTTLGFAVAFTIPTLD